MRSPIHSILLAAVLSALVMGIPAPFKKELTDIGKKISTCKMAVMSNKLEGKSDELDGFEKELKDLAAKAGVTESDSDIARQRGAVEECRKELAKRLAKKDASAAAEAARTAKSAEAAEAERSEQAKLDAKKAEHDAKSAGEQGSVDELFKKTETLFLFHKEEVIAIDTFLRKVNKTENEKEFLAMLADGMKAVQRAKEILPLFGDRKGLQELDRRNADAKECRFFSKIGFLPGIIEDIERKRLSGRDSLIFSAGHSLSALKSAGEPRLAGQFYDEINEIFGVLDRLYPGDEKVTSEKTRILAEAKEALEKVSQRIADARMPKDVYSGSDGAELRDTMKNIHLAKYPEDAVLRIVITAPSWIEEARAEIDPDGKIIGKVYRFIGAEVATKGKEGCTVCVYRFRRIWTGRGDEFGPVELHSIGGGYRIQEGNVTK
ncbi:MAG: hypothetical protein AABZ39_19620 [Spirochaetota bacterium]